MKPFDNLDDPRLMSALDAAKRWGISDARLRQKIEDFPKGTIRKFGKQWVVTESGMVSVFGKIKSLEGSVMEKYIINYHTGVTHEIEVHNLQEAQEEALNGIAYTQENVSIETLEGEVLSVARWYGVRPDEDDDVLTEIGGGFYSAWSEL